MKTTNINPLTTSENKAYALLTKVNPDTLWGLGIMKVISDFTPEKFRKLITDLKSQNKDCPEVMKAILGDAYESVIAL
jgi:hypothetical protein